MPISLSTYSGIHFQEFIVLDERFFDLQQFFQDLAIPQSEHAEVEKCFTKGVVAYYQHIFGYDKYGKNPTEMIAERMYEPYVFGFGAVVGVRSQKLAIATRQAIVKYTFQQVDPTEEYGIPYGLPILLSFLAETKVLDAATFRSVLLMAIATNTYALEEMQRQEMLSLLDWIITQSVMPESEQIWWLQLLPCQINKPAIGKPFAEHLLQHPQLSDAFKRELCQAWLSDQPTGTAPLAAQVFLTQLSTDESALEALFFEPTTETTTVVNAAPKTPQPAKEFGTLGTTLLQGKLLNNIPNHIQRLALAQLVALSPDPLAVCQAYFQANSSGSRAEALNQEVADVLRSHQASIDPQALRQFIDQAIGSKISSIRKTFYQLGFDLFGQAYLHQAKQDKTKSICDWAAKQERGSEEVGSAR
jgi:hypothetical protein